MDSNELERERGITILAKNTAIFYRDHQDQHRGHPRPQRLRRRGRARPDDGGRGDAARGRERRSPAPDPLRAQQSAGARPAADRGHQQDRPRRRAARSRCSTRSTTCSSIWTPRRSSSSSRCCTRTPRPAPPRPAADVPGTDLRPLFDAIVATVPPPAGRADAPLQVLVANLDYSDFLGRIAIARVFNGTLVAGKDVGIAKLDGSLVKTRITKLFTFSGLRRTEVAARGGGRHHRRRRGRGHHDRRDDHGRGDAGAAAAHRGRRTDDRHAVQRQHVPPRGPRGRPT